MLKESAQCVRGMNTALVCVCSPWNEIVSSWCKPTTWQRFVVTIEGRLERYHCLQDNGKFLQDLPWDPNCPKKKEVKKAHSPSVLPDFRKLGSKSVSPVN